MLLQLDQMLTLAINGSHSLYVDHMAVLIAQTVTWIPLAAVLAYVLLRHNDLVSFGETLLAIALCILLADQGASSVAKPLFMRYRPAHDPMIMYAVDIVNGYRGGLYGFFSSHASNTFAVATFVSLLIRQRLLTALLFCWALANCWSRAYLGVHYVGDLLTGAVWGFLVGYGIYSLWVRFSHHSVIWLKYHASQAQPGSPAAPNPLLTSSGYSVKSADLLSATMVATFLYITIRSLW